MKSKHNISRRFEIIFPKYEVRGIPYWKEIWPIKEARTNMYTFYSQPINKTNPSRFKPSSSMKGSVLCGGDPVLH